MSAGYMNAGQERAGHQQQRGRVLRDRTQFLFEDVLLTADFLDRLFQCTMRVVAHSPAYTCAMISLEPVALLQKSSAPMGCYAVCCCAANASCSLSYTGMSFGISARIMISRT